MRYLRCEVQEAKKDKERRIQATLRCTKEIDSLMGQSKDAISWPSTENDLFWSISLSPFYEDYRELRAARHRKDKVPRCRVEVKNISSASSNRLSWDPVEDCRFEAQACRAHSPRQETGPTRKEPPTIKLMDTQHTHQTHHARTHAHTTHHTHLKEC